ncbi:MAG: B12-binding domain-containing radical SAM protein [Anaerolineae bacterium]|nr:B12-binding domain-containing radical SAM protein [Rhodocyclaceae bacterium]MCZ2116055.1 B12-binding domain-containing radical SAM protein [Anaerolineae bacterium]
MRIVLISTPSRTSVPNYIIPNGIISLAAYMEEQGHEVKVVDAAALREPNGQIITRVAEFRPDLIGIGGIITAYSYIISLSNDIRQAMPSIPILLGGQVAINNIENCYRHMAIDYIVHGYGEIALGKLAQHLEGKVNIELIPGVSYLDKGFVVTNPGREFFPDINKMPLPAYHLIDMEHYATVNGHRLNKLQKYLDKTGKKVENHRFCTVMGTLGCTDRCSFCVHEQEFVGLKIFSNEYLLKHIRHLYENYQIRVFAIGEEMFLTKVARAREFNALMKEQFPDVYWSASTRADFVTPDMIAELETGNCFYVAWGFESGSQKMLDMMKKRMTRKQNIAAYVTTDNSKLVPACSLMVGNVGETNETINETIEAIRLGHIGRSSVFYASAYPGGRTWDWAVERGIIKDTHQYLLAASDKDAASRINVNLTPFPDWILKGWQQLLIWECEKQEVKKSARLFSHQSLLSRIRQKVRSLIGYSGIPAPLYSVLIKLYFFYYSITKKYFLTAKDKQYEYKLDKQGALLPNNLIVGQPQHYFPPDKIIQLNARPKTRTAL